MNFLVVDDSTFMRTFLKNILIENGYNVIGEAKSGRTAVERYKELKPDIVTLDITMDDMSGLEALKIIKKYDTTAKVIMISAMGQDAIVREAILSGARGFLVKPFDKDLVLSTISQLRG